MAERVVDVLEMVEIEEHQRRLPPRAADLPDGNVEVLHHLAAVGQTGERVVQRKETRPLLGALDGADIGFADQHRIFAGDRVAAVARGDLVPAFALRGVHRHGPRGDAGVCELRPQAGERLAIGDAVVERLVDPARRIARRRVAVKRPAVAPIQRDHHGGVQQRLDRPQRLRLHPGRLARLAQHRHAAVGEAVAAEANAQRHRLPAGVERPLLVEAGARVGEIGLVLRQPPRHGLGHVRAHVAPAQFGERGCVPDPQRRTVGPVHAVVVDVEHPHRVADEVQRVITAPPRRQVSHGAGPSGTRCARSGHRVAAPVHPSRAQATVRTSATGRAEGGCPNRG